MKFSSLFITFMVCSALFACDKKDNNTPAGNAGKVSIANFAFSSSSLTVKAGTTVTWTNNDAAAHTVTADDNSFASSTLNQGAVYTHTFATAGTYAYHCQFHSMMKGTIIVQ